MQQDIQPGFEFGESPVLVPQQLGFALDLLDLALDAGIASPVERLKP